MFVIYAGPFVNTKVLADLVKYVITDNTPNQVFDSGVYLREIYR